MSKAEVDPLIQAEDDEDEREALKHALHPFSPTQGPLPPAAHQLDTSLPDPLGGRRPPNYPEFVRDFWREAYEDRALTLAQLERQRTRVAWRFIRELLQILEVYHHDPLDEIEAHANAERDPWLEPRPWQRRLPAPGTNRAWEVIHVLHKQSTDPRAALPLLPPPAPHPLPQDYDPAQDQRLLAYIQLIEAVDRLVGLSAGTKTDKDAGRRGLQGLLDPKTIRLSFPSRLQLIAFEQALVDEVLDQLVQNGQQKAVRFAQEAHGLTTKEALSVVKLAGNEARKRLEVDAETHKALMTLRLENFIQRTRESLDPRLEMHALKQLCIVLGIARMETEDALTDFWKTAKRITESSSPPSLTIDSRATHKRIDTSE